MDRLQSTSSAPEERVRVIAAQAQARARLAGVLAEACSGAGATWTAKLIAAVAAAVEFAATEPDEARLLLLDAVAIDPALGVGALQTHDFLADLLRGGRDHCPRAAGMPELTERAMVGAATSLVGAKLLDAEATDLLTLVSPLTQLFLTPYVGRERARQLALG